MNRAETYEFVEGLLESSSLGDDYTVTDEADGCELQFQWQDDAFYRRMNVTASDSRLLVEVSCYRNLNGDSSARYYEKHIGDVVTKNENLVEGVISTAVDVLSSIDVEDLEIHYRESGVPTQINYKDSYLDEGWEVSHVEVEKRANGGERFFDW